MIRLYISGIASQTIESDFSAHFEKYGRIESLEFFMDAETNQSKGFAFITMLDKAAKQVMETLSGQLLDGQVIEITELGKPFKWEDRNEYPSLVI